MALVEENESNGESYSYQGTRGELQLLFNRLEGSAGRTIAEPIYSYESLEKCTRNTREFILNYYYVPTKKIGMAKLSSLMSR